MCGRYGISVSRDELEIYLKETYQIELLDSNITLPRYNIAPGQLVISLINDGTRYRVGLLKWGFVPEWADDEKIGYKLINARRETLSEKPTFKKSFQTRRCVIIADGFFEWYRTTSTKTPYYFYLKDHRIFGFAGLWSTFSKPDGTKISTCTIITTKANAMMRDIHDRMPVILTEDTAKRWLDPTLRDIALLDELLGENAMDDIELHQVSSRVNKTENDDSDIIKPYED